MEGGRFTGAIAGGAKGKQRLLEGPSFNDLGTAVVHQGKSSLLGQVLSFAFGPHSLWYNLLEPFAVRPTDQGGGLIGTSPLPADVDRILLRALQ